MTKDTREKIEFYLDALEVLNKPRRIFMGLEYQIDVSTGYSDKEKSLARKIIKQACKDFYTYTLPKFEAEIKKL